MMTNPFSIFSNAELADSINLIPNNYGRINQLGLFPVSGKRTNVVTVEWKNGVLSLIASDQYGGPGVTQDRPKREADTIKIPKFEVNDLIKASDVQNVRAFASDQPAALAELLNDVMTTTRQRHDITLEWLRMGALKGLVLDATGGTLLNIYTKFGVTETDIDFVLGTSTTDVEGKLIDLAESVGKGLNGDVMSGIHVFTDISFFKKLLNHPKVEKINNRDRIQVQVARGGMLTWSYNNITFEAYTASATKPDGSTQAFIAADTGHAFPVGTSDTFSTYAAPADFIETVGQAGQLYYAKVIPEKFDRGYELHTQMNAMPICKRPRALVRVHTSN